MTSPIYTYKNISHIQELSKRASLLTNKVLKHGFVSEMETILDKDDKVSHSQLTDKVKLNYYKMYDNRHMLFCHSWRPLSSTQILLVSKYRKNW